MADASTTSDIRKTIGVRAGKKKAGTSWAVIAVVGVLALAVVGWLAVKGGSGSKGPDFATTKVERGDLTVTVTAVGELAPLNKVDVGIEVSGTLDQVLVDNNDRVKTGQLLAKVNTDQLEAQVRRARATLTSAEARVGEAEATLADAKRTLDRTRELRSKGVATQEALDAAISAYDRGMASLNSAKAQVDVSQADLADAETRLRKAEVYSPVDGVILDRKVDQGQTVIAAMQTPVLFTIAEDLSKMELKVRIDEADIGDVQPGQKATFGVDAYPNRRFSAEITRVRYNSTTTEGVVTYETLLTVDNSDLALRPGMTASAVITVANVENALLVPNEALRFRPEDWGLGVKEGFPEPAKDKDKATSARRAEEPQGEGEITTGEVWALRAGKPEKVTVEVGASNGRYTIVKSDSIAADETLITGVREKSQG